MYETLASDYMPRGKGSNNKQLERKLRSLGLYSMDWRRVVLDKGFNKGSTVRNPASRAARLSLH